MPAPVPEPSLGRSSPPGRRAWRAVRYLAVELSAAQRALHPADVESRADLPEGPIDGVIVANELLDNLPFRLCVFDGAWREAFVIAVNGTFSEVLSAPLDPVPAALPPAPAARLAGTAAERRC